MKKHVAIFGMVWLLLAAALMLGCSKQEEAKLEVPQRLSTEQIKQYTDLTEQGYQVLNEGNLDSAVALFTKQTTMLPGTAWGYYNLACAYSRQGQVDQAYNFLEQAVAHGWDNPDHLIYDTDLTALREDPRFSILGLRVDSTVEAREKMFVAGMPEYDKPIREFTSVDDIQTWQNEQRQELLANRAVWKNWEFKAALLDHQAQMLAARKAVQKDDTTINWAFERVAAVSSLPSIYEESWGGMSSAVITEVDRFLLTNPPDSLVAVAALYGGLAAIKHFGLGGIEMPEWPADLSLARKYLAMIKTDSPFYGRSQALLLAADLAEARQNRSSLADRVKEFSSTYANDQAAMQYASILFFEDMIRAQWPIPFEATDINGKKVSPADFKDKVLLLDFWATWCGPCRGELPYLTAAYEKYKKDGFEILSISLDYPNRIDQEAYKQWIKENGMNWRHVYDEQAWSSPIVQAFSVSSIPSPFLIGRDGSLVAMQDGCRGEQLEESIKKAL